MQIAMVAYSYLTKAKNNTIFVLNLALLRYQLMAKSSILFKKNVSFSILKVPFSESVNV